MRERMVTAAWLAAAVTVSLAHSAAGWASAPTPALPAPGVVTTARLDAVNLRDSAGKGHRLAELGEPPVLVLIFTGADCPITNDYSARLAALAARYETKGVRFLAINANPDEPLKLVAERARAYKLPFPVWKDDKQALADLLDARVTPEAFVLDVSKAVCYRGRIDNSYESRTRKRAQAVSNDLEEAIQSVLDGRLVKTPVTSAIGCGIVRRSQIAAHPTVTYYRDVAPVVQHRCQACHRPGQVAPFSLLTFADARRWAREMQTLTTARTMPPWLAEPGHGDFQDVRRLSDQEVRTLSVWADEGAPAGNIKDAPPARTWTTEWTLGKPDLILTPTEPYHVAATGPDDFRVFVLPTGLTEDKQVVAMDFRPGNPRVVHHVVSFVDTTGKGRELDAADPGPGYSSGPVGIKVPDATIQGVWAPGNLPRFLPTGVGRPLPKNGDILIQVHYHKTGKEETDQTQVALYFAKEPVKQEAHTAIFGPFRIDIPPNEPYHQEKFSMEIPADVIVLNIMPHMHLLGKEMKVTATFPNGETKDLVWIRNWDYRWQDSYRYREPLLLPKGTRIEVVSYYDNTTNNPRNPSNPPRRVRFGEQTTDEMGFAVMEVVFGAMP